LCDTCQKRYRCSNCKGCIYLTRNLNALDNIKFECKEYKNESCLH
jgi:hypothetical protein